MVFSILSNALNIITIALFFTKILGKQLYIKRFILCIITHFVLSGMAYQVKKESIFIAHLILFVINVVVFKLCISNVQIKTILYACLMIYFVNLILSYTMITFFKLSRSTYVFLECGVNLCLCVLAVITCFSKIITKAKVVISSTPRSVKASILLLLILCVINIALMADLQFFITNERLLFVIQVISLSSLLVICIAFPVIVLISTANTHLKNLTKNYEQQIEAQALHYSELSKSNLEIRKFRHDLKNIKIGVAQLIKEGKYQEAVQTLEVAEGENNAVLAFDTGNGIVDALLADKQKKAELNNIKIDFNGAIPTEVIMPTDLCVIFGNTIDNAMEACEKLNDNSDKTIKVECKCNSGFMFLNMSNPVDKKVSIKNNSIKTTKTNSALHGFGLYSLNKVIKKHDGEIKLSCDDNIFVLDISLCLK